MIGPRSLRASSTLRAHRPDYILILAFSGLLLIGLIIIYSISPVLSHKILGDVNNNYFLYGQLLHMGVGLAGLIAASRMHYSKWEKLLPALIIVSALGLLLLMIPGVRVAENGATRWVDIGPVTFQPAELIKLTLVVFLAVNFSRNLVTDGQESQRRLRLSIAVLTILGIFVLLAQRDMGTMLVLSAILLGQFFVSGVRLREVGWLMGLGLIVGVLSILIFPHRVARLVTFFDPSKNDLASGYHLDQSLIAIGSGGVTGLGVGKSIQVYGYLPEAANDSIFAILGETLGFIGAVLIIGLFIILIYRGFKIAMNAPNRFAQLLVVGIVIWIAVQAAINIMAMVGLIPLTGVPLPFLSYGGTSLITLLVAIGIVLNISKYTKKGLYADSLDRRWNRRPRYAYSGVR